MPQTRRIWLPRLLTSYTSPPRMSRNGYDKTTCEIGAQKRHVKARNLNKNTESCEYVVGGNAPGTTYLTSAAQTSHTPLSRMESYDLRNTHLISYVNTVRWWSWWYSLSCRLYRSITWSKQGVNTRIEGNPCPVEHCRFMLVCHCHGEYTSQTRCW